MGEYKWIKDTVHGYIKIEKEFLRIVNSPEFQRLKWIEQGSFRVLYPSARHDRFIHSLGVFGLARECFVNLIDNIKNDLGAEFICEENVQKWKYTFLYAALLHDIGHAPFSHTFELFFSGLHGINPRERLSNKNISLINQVNQKSEKQCDVSTLSKPEIDLLNAYASIKDISDENICRFIEDFLIEDNGINPKVHEIISATILIEQIDSFLLNTALYNEIDLGLAARMVIGCTHYSHLSKNDKKLGIENVLIRLLNSTILDVDKLDYIIRDTKMSGYDNINLDVKRLISSVTAVQNEDGIFPAYSKKVLSTIDSLFRAKNQENMWMIIHPVVEYEKSLITSCVTDYDKIHPGYIESVFTKEALSQEIKIHRYTVDNVTQENEYRLLSDLDILCDIKTMWGSSETVREYFDSNLRKHPLWKSIYEYSFFWKDNKENFSTEDIFDYFKPLITYMNSNDIFTLNYMEYNKIKNLNETDNNKKVMHAAEIFADFCEDNDNIEFSFTILEIGTDFLSNMFEQSIYINFENEFSSKQTYETYYNIVKETQTQNLNKKSGFFYIYSKVKFTPENVRSFIDTTITSLKKNTHRKTKIRA